MAFTLFYTILSVLFMALTLFYSIYLLFSPHFYSPVLGLHAVYFYHLDFCPSCTILVSGAYFVV